MDLTSILHKEKDTGTKHFRVVSRLWRDENKGGYTLHDYLAHVDIRDGSGSVFGHMYKLIGEANVEFLRTVEVENSPESYPTWNTLLLELSKQHPLDDVTAVEVASDICISYGDRLVVPFNVYL